MKLLVLSRVIRCVSVLVFCLVLFGSVFAQRKLTIAVLPFVESGRAKFGAMDLTNWLFEELEKSSQLVMVERQKIETIEVELLKNLRDRSDPSVVRDIGQKIGAEILVVGNLTEYTEKQKSSLSGMSHFENIVRFNLKAIRSSNNEVVFSKTFEKTGYGIGDPNALNKVARNTVKDAAIALTKKIAPSVEK